MLDVGRKMLLTPWMRCLEIKWNPLLQKTCQKTVECWMQMSSSDVKKIIWHFKSNSTVTVIIIMSDAVVSESAGYIIVWSHLLKAVGIIISNSHYSLGPSVRARWAAPSVSILEYRVQSIEKFKSRWNGCISCRVSNSLFILWNKV